MTPQKASKGDPPTVDYHVIDADAVFDRMIAAEAADAETNATLAELDARQYQILSEMTPGRADVTAQRDLRADIATSRRARADGIAKRAGIKTPDLTEIRLTVALQLLHAESNQVALEERFANLDLYAVTEQEAAEQRRAIDQIQHLNPMASLPVPLTAEQIGLDALQGRAAVQALTEWLTANPPAEIPDAETDERAKTDPARRAALDVARHFYGLAKPAAATSADG
jgi:hypothetical protein